MAQQQYYGIKYPFTSDSEENFYLDINHSLKTRARSEILHVIFTPKGQKIRDPEFGTNLIKFIFENNDEETWEAVKTEISDAVSMFTHGIRLNNIEVVRSEDDPAMIYVKIDYSIKQGNSEINDKIVTKL